MNYHSDEYIQAQVQRHYNEALKYYPEDKIIGIFLCGSANYNLDSKNSDTDTKLIVLPNFSDIVKGNQLHSVCHEIENGEHIEAKDIREMMRNLKKSNMNFLEILCTSYYILNPEYAEDFKPMQDNCNLIALYNNHAYVNAIRGMAERAYNCIFKDMPSTHEVYEKHGWSAKFLYRLIKEAQMLIDYIDGVNFSMALTNEAEKIGLIKNHGYELYTLDEVKEKAAELIGNLRLVCDDYLSTNKKVILSTPEQIMYNVTEEILRKSFQKDWAIAEMMPICDTVFTNENGEEV